MNLALHLPWSRRTVIGIVHCYQKYISPYRLPTCRFMPTCSQYAVEALQFHNVMYAMFLIGKRLLKCGPWHKGGWDPVPASKHKKRKILEAEDETE